MGRVCLPVVVLLMLVQGCNSRPDGEALLSLVRAGQTEPTALQATFDRMRPTRETSAAVFEQASVEAVHRWLDQRARERPDPWQTLGSIALSEAARFEVSPLPVDDPRRRLAQHLKAPGYRLRVFTPDGSNVPVDAFFFVDGRWVWYPHLTHHFTAFFANRGAPPAQAPAEGVADTPAIAWRVELHRVRLSTVAVLAGGAWRDASDPRSSPVQFHAVAADSATVLAPRTAPSVLRFESGGPGLFVSIIDGVNAPRALVVRYLDVPLASGTPLELRLGIEAPERLRADLDGDGIYELQLQPTAEAFGEAARDDQPPTVSVGVRDAGGGVSEVAVGAADPSGVAQVQVSFDGRSFAVYTAPLRRNIGSPSMRYLSVIADDLLGNRTPAALTFDLHRDGARAHRPVTRLSARSLEWRQARDQLGWTGKELWALVAERQAVFVSGAAFQPDGKIVVVARISRRDGPSSPRPEGEMFIARIGRLSASGSPDLSFVTAGPLFEFERATDREIELDEAAQVFAFEDSLLLSSFTAESSAYGHSDLFVELSADGSARGRVRLPATRTPRQSFLDAVGVDAEGNRWLKIRGDESKRPTYARVDATAVDPLALDPLGPPGQVRWSPSSSDARGRTVTVAGEERVIEVPRSGRRDYRAVATLERRLSDGTLDTAFNDQAARAIALHEIERIRSVDVASDGKVLLAFDSGLLVLAATGAVDRSFGSPFGSRQPRSSPERPRMKSRKTPLLYLAGRRLEFHDDGGIWIYAVRSSGIHEGRADLVVRTASARGVGEGLGDEELGARLATGSERLDARTADEESVPIARYPDGSMVTIASLGRAARLNDALRAEVAARAARIGKLELGPLDEPAATIPLASEYLAPTLPPPTAGWVKALASINWPMVPEPYRGAHLTLRVGTAGAVEVAALELFVRYAPGLVEAPAAAAVEPPPAEVQFNGHRFTPAPGVDVEGIAREGAAADGKVRFVVQLVHEPGPKIRAEHRAAGMTYLASLGATATYFAAMPARQVAQLRNQPLIRAAFPWTRARRLVTGPEADRLQELRSVPNARVTVQLGVHVDVSPAEISQTLQAVGAQDLQELGGLPYPSWMATVTVPAFHQLAADARFYSVAVLRSTPARFEQPGAGPPARYSLQVLRDGEFLALRFSNPGTTEVTLLVPRQVEVLAHADQRGLRLRGDYSCPAEYVHRCFHASPLTLPPRGAARAQVPLPRELRSLSDSRWVAATVLLQEAPPAAPESVELPQAPAAPRAEAGTLGELRVPVEVRLGEQVLSLRFTNTHAEPTSHPIPRRFELLAHPDQGGLVLRGDYRCPEKYVHFCYHATTLTVPPHATAEAQVSWRGPKVQGMNDLGWTPATLLLRQRPERRADDD